MGEERFWALIDRLGRKGNVGRLVAALARLSGEEIVGFHERLRTAVAALDTPAHRRQPVADAGGGGPMPASEDAFEDARLAVVAAGRHRWADVVADPAGMVGPWPLQVGELLGWAAADAYEQATGDPWPHLGLDSPPASGLPPISRQDWLLVVLPDGGFSPAPYELQMHWLERRLNQPEWERWWDAGRGADGSTLTCWYEFHPAGRRRSTVRIGPDASGRTDVTVTIRLPQPDRDSDPAELARSHVGLLLEVLRSKLGLDHPPALPPAADLERDRLVAAERDAAETEDFLAWNRERTTAVPNIWAGRAPAAAVDELVFALECGGRIRLPALIAAMRHRHGIPATAEDARLLAGHGYSAEEITTALA